MRILLICCLYFIPYISYSQEWKSLYQKAESSYNSNAFEAAYESGVQALEKYKIENGETNDSYASILRLLANICFSQDKLDEGLGFIQKEIQIREGKKDLLLSNALDNAAEFHKAMGNYEKAIEQLAQSKEILLNFYSATDVPVVECDLDLAINHYLANDNQQAYTLFNNSLQHIKEENLEILSAYYYFGLLSLELGQAESALNQFATTKKKYENNKLQETIEYALVVKAAGEAYHQLRQFEAADNNYQMAQLLFEKLGQGNDEEYFHLLNGRAINLEMLGKITEAEALFTTVSKHPEGKLAYATALNNRATISQSKGDFKKAMGFYNSAIAQLDKTKKTESILLAETLQNTALLEVEMKDYDKAIATIEESHQLIIKALGESHPRAISSFNKQAIIYLKTKEVEKAKSIFEKTLILIAANQPNNNLEIAVSQSGLAQCAQKEGEFKKADSLYKLVISMYDQSKIPKDENYTKSQLLYASSLQDIGNLEQAASVLLLAANQVKKSKGALHLNYGLLQENLALLNLKLGHYARAKNLLDSAEASYDTDEKKNSREFGALLLSEGRYHQILGEYPKAESSLRKGADILLKTAGENSEDYASAMNGLALFYQTMGNFVEAEPLFTKALKVRESKGGKLNSEYATVLQNLASLYQLQEKYGKAEPLLQEANEIDKQVLGTNHPQYLVSLQNLATLYQKKKELDKAAFIMESVRTIKQQKSGRNQASYATVLSNLASLYQDQGNYDASEKLWLESVTLRKQLLGEDHPDYARSLYGLAGVYFATGKLEQAAPYFTQVVEKYERQIENYFDALSENEKGAFYNRIRPVFETYQDFCIQSLAQKVNSEKVTERLYDLQLSTKAILLNASSKVRNTIMNSGDVELKQLFQNWQKTKEDLVRYYSLTTEERVRLNIDLNQTEQLANDLEKKLTELSSHFNNLNKKKVSWKDVQTNLKPGETAIEIIRIKKKFVADSVYYAALVLHAESTSPKLFIWPEGAKLETKWFRYHRNAIKFHIKDTLSFKHLWAPLLKDLHTAQTLYISCDGIFNKINLNCIQNTETQKWVLDEYNIHLVSNTRELTESHPSMKLATQQASVFGFADFNLTAANQVSSANSKRASRFGFQGEEIPMLPATQKEVSLLTNLLTEKSWNISSFTLLEATEDNLKKINNPQILHIATHGFFLNDIDISDELEGEEESHLIKNPLFRSGILMAGAGAPQVDGKDDGVLSAYEAMNLTLDNTELVSLSACETGLGEVRNGEGVYGLQRSFLVAGARTVIMSLWQVDDDATQELMSSFYKQWINGQDKFQAFRNAQLEIKEKYKLPYYWGAFVLIGN